MAQATADTLVAPAGALRGRFGRGTPALPVSLGFDRANPAHLCLRCPITGPLDDLTLARVQYKAPAANTWIDGPFLPRVRLADLGTLPADLVGKVTDSFVGTAFGVAVPSASPTALDVRLAVFVPSQATQYVTGTHTPAAVAAPAPAVTHTCTPATFAAVLASLPHQSGADVHLRLSAGVYTWSALQWAKGGTQAKPLYVSAAALGDVTINTPTGTCVAPAADDVVFERLRFQGSGTHSGTAATSAWMIPATGRRTRRWTVRGCEVLGFDRALKAFEPVDDFHVYYTRLAGNYPWALAYQDNGGQPNLTWNGDAFALPGSGNCVWQCTIGGHGDLFRVHTSSGLFFSAGSGWWQCDVLNTGDDALEADDGAGNIFAWRNRIKNCGNAVSVDGTYGPTYFTQCVVANSMRGPIKATSTSYYALVQQNTFVLAEKWASGGGTSHGVLTPSAGNQRGLQLTNNVFHYTGVGNALHWSAPLVGETWGNNAWYPDRGFFINGTGTYANLAAAKAGNPARFASDVVLPAQPFATPITLGATYATEYTGTPAAALAVGSPARNAGRVIPGITDGYTGAAPDIGAVISGQAAVAYGVPTFEWSNLAPLTLPTMPAAGTIGTLGTSVLNSVATGGAEETFQYPKVLGAWGSALLVRLYNAAGQLADILYVIQGGGHGDSGWDGVAYYSLRQQAYLLALAPEHLAAVAIEVDTAVNPWGEHASGRPASAHPWTHNVGIDGDELGGPAFIRTRGAGAGQSGTVFGGSHDFFWATKQFTRRGSTAAPATAQSIHVTIKDRTRGLIHRFPCSPNGDYYTLDYRAAGSAWVTRTQALRTGLGWTDTDSANGCHVPHHDLLVACNFTGAGSLRALPAGATDGTWVSLSTTGLALPTQRVGLQYRSATGSILMMDMSTAVPTGVFEVTPPTTQPLTNPWVVTRRAFTGSSSLAIYAGLREIVDRYQYVHELDALMACPSPTAPMETWKL